TLGDVASELGDWKAASRHYQESLALAREARRDGLAWWLEQLAEDDAARRPERAARLLAASAAMREVDSQPAAAGEAASRECAIAAAHAALGEEAFRAAWARGSLMGPERAIQEAYRMG